MMHRTAIVLLGVLLATACTPARYAFAQSHGEAPAGGAHNEHAVAESAGHDDHGGGKPALLDWDLGSAAWSIVVFVLLLIILRATAWKPILEALQKREEFIRESLASAKRDREEAERTLAEYTRRVEQARQEATAIVEEGRRDAEEVRKRIAAEAKGEADAMITRARKEIDLARQDAVKRLHDEAIVLATAVAGKIVRTELTGGDHRRLLDEAVQELAQTQH